VYVILLKGTDFYRESALTHWAINDIGNCRNADFMKEGYISYHQLQNNVHKITLV